MKIDKKVSDNILELSKIMDKNNLLEIDISDGKNSYRLKKISHQSNIIENNKNLKSLIHNSESNEYCYRLSFENRDQLDNFKNEIDGIDGIKKKDVSYI